MSDQDEVELKNDAHMPLNRLRGGVGEVLHPEGLSTGMAIENAPAAPLAAKTCRVCQEEKPLTEFHRHKRYADGYETTCKMCRREIADKPMPPRPMYYPFNRAALPAYRHFLNEYARGTMWRKPAVIVSVPVAERAALEVFCVGVGLAPDEAIYDLPRANAADDRVGVILYGVSVKEVRELSSTP